MISEAHQVLGLAEVMGVGVQLAHEAAVALFLLINYLGFREWHRLD